MTLESPNELESRTGSPLPPPFPLLSCGMRPGISPGRGAEAREIKANASTALSWFRLRDLPFERGLDTRRRVTPWPLSPFAFFLPCLFIVALAPLCPSHGRMFGFWIYSLVQFNVQIAYDYSGDLLSRNRPARLIAGNGWRTCNSFAE